MEKVTIGQVSSAHGIAGEITVIPLTDYPERFMSMEKIELYSHGRFVRSLEVKGVRVNESKGTLIIKSCLTDRDEAQALAGTLILVDAPDRVPLPEGHYWVDDLVGLRVEDTGGGFLGTVKDFLTVGGNEIYEISDENGKLHYIPAVEEFVRNIDLTAGKITLSLIEGLW